MVISRRGTSLGFFEELYAIVVGLGLALAIEQVIDLGRDGLPVRAEHIAVFLAYLNIAFALAHASVRYLQITYSEMEVPVAKARVVADLILGVGHFLWLLTLSFLITRPIAFAGGVIVLLIGRPVRDLFLWLRKRQWLDFDRKVATVHMVTIVVLLAGLGVALLAPESAEATVMRGVSLAASLGFGLGLYLWAFEFFFPSPRPAESSPKDL